MKSLKHSKFRNTGILFELLVRQITADTLNGVTESKAAPIIRKYFGKKTELSKELDLYQTLVKEKFAKENKAQALIEVVVDTRRKLNNSNLRRQKHNLVKEIRDNFVLEDFFNSRVSNYKVLASIYKLFEYNQTDNPVEAVECKYTLAEHITQTKKSSKEKDSINEVTEIYKQENKDIRMLTTKLLVDKFNDKYSGLNEAQQGLLKNYINNVSNTTSLKEYVSGEVNKLQKDIRTLSKKVGDKVVKIKLAEVYKLLSELKKGKVVKDNEVLSLLRYYDLVSELKKVVLK